MHPLQSYGMALLTGAIVSVSQRLFQYLDGGNEKGQKMDMTVPLASLIKPVSGFRGSEENYTFALYVPVDEEVRSSHCGAV